MKIKFLAMFIVVAFLGGGCKSMFEQLLAPQPIQATDHSPTCSDIEILGLYSQPWAGDKTQYLAKLRNKGSIERNVTVEYIDMYGATKTCVFEIKAGEIINGQLAVQAPYQRRPRSLKLANCL